MTAKQHTPHVTYMYVHGQSNTRSATDFLIELLSFVKHRPNLNAKIWHSHSQTRPALVKYYNVLDYILYVMHACNTHSLLTAYVIQCLAWLPLLCQGIVLASHRPLLAFLAKEAIMWSRLNYRYPWVTLGLSACPPPWQS